MELTVLSDDGQNVRVAEMTCGTCARKASYYCDVTTWAVGDGDECSVPPEFGGMSWEPKTCGTCADWVRVFLDDGVCSMQGVSGDCDDRDNYVVTARSDECSSPAYYRKRGDSVELVALDMLDEILEWDSRHPDEMPDAGDESKCYASRLRRLGVIR